MIPFIAALGRHTWVFRLPQVIVAICTIIAVEKIVKEIMNEEVALWVMFFLAINPWHIMMSRWGLESNLTPGFLIFGLLFFIMGLKNEKYYLLSALFYGLSLYCYAVIWAIVPFIILFQTVYLYYVKKIKITRWTVMAGILLGVLATPALLFLLVNKGIIPEIVTPWFSVPKLVVMRDSEISLMQMNKKIRNLCSILINENDGAYSNTTEQFGLYYKCFLIFAVIGLFYWVKGIYHSLKTRNYDGYVLIGIQFLLSFCLGTVVYVNVNRINCIHISIIIFMAVGIYHVQKLLRMELKYISEATVLGLLLLFFSFESFYFGEYAENIGTMFQSGMESAVQYAELLSDEKNTIYVGEGIYYSKILAFSDLTTDEYMETVQYDNYPSPYLSISQCGNYVFNVSAEGNGGIYIVDLTKQAENYADMGYTVEKFGTIAVLYK